MIIGLIGLPFSGRATLAEYLELEYQFKVIDLENQDTLQEFGILDGKLEAGDETTESSPSKQSEKQEKILWEADDLVSKLEILIRELLKRDWRQKWVVYPIPSSETMKTMMKWSRIILYQIEAPLDVRLARAKAKDVDISEFIKTTANFE